jgi:crotonobetainyl-CoA:carnitine CoA-transferase CaiB-like acyl-CoA transferase
MPELARDERFTHNADRVANRVVLRSLLAAAFATRTGRAWFDALAEAGVPCGPINDIATAFSLADELGLRPIVDADGSRQVAHPIRFSRTPPQYRLAPPTLGEHTDDVLYGQGHG